MKFFCLAGVVALSLLSLDLFSIEATAQTMPYIENIEGSDQVDVERGGNTAPALEGDELQEKDKIKTGADNSVRIGYPDGSMLTLGATSILEVEAPEGGASSAKLISGTVQAVISKKSGSSSAADHPHKFFVKTGAAVMGVRGTEFVVDHDETGAGTQVHTLDGSVDVGQDVESVRSGHGTPVTKNQAIEASLHGGISSPHHFDRKKFILDFRKRHPRIAAIARRAARSLREIKRLRHRKKRLKKGEDRRQKRDA